MSDKRIAYFSAEIGIDDRIKTYSGGLGILAGGTIKAMADLGVPFCAVTLLYKKGYFKQKIENCEQVELDDLWNYEDVLIDTGKEISVNISGVDVRAKIWQFDFKGVGGHVVPIYFLDTNLEGNPDWACEITEHLYVGDRISQEILLGIGGLRALDALGHDSIEKYHMNEGHSCFLTLELYKRLGNSIGWDDGLVRDKCVFTTHTPIPAGHDRFEYSDIYDRLRGEKNIIPLHIRKLAGDDVFNTTKLALNFSSYCNAVARKHGEVTREMFPNHTIDYVTNGVHAASWAHFAMAELFDRYVPGWRSDFTKLSEASKIPNSEIYRAHLVAKKEMVDYVNKHNYVGSVLKDDVLTIGFARRFIAYKEADLIFKNIDNLKRLGKKVQFIFAGKSHKKDGVGKSIMKRIIERSIELKDDISIAFVEDYNKDIAKRLVSGCDLWLNTPIPFNEASGTSGMKAAVNGCMHFSRLDGWAIESFEMNGGGFPISEYSDFITDLEYKIIPMFYADDKTSWVNEMKLSISVSGAYFNTHRMAKEYVKKAYKL